jgi:diacylglycerol O-acyltransferase
MYERMSPLDAAFLELEDEDPHVSLAISSAAILDGPAPSHEDFLAVLRPRLPLVPRYRHKVRQVPLDLGLPVWVDDPQFDLNRHVRRTALPAPGDEAAFCALMARVMSQRLDRRHPLWEYWVVEGLAGGRWALISKVHHCLVDGVSGTHLYYAIFDESPTGTRIAIPADTWSAAPEPSTVRLTAGALLELARSPIEQARLIRTALRTPRATVRRVAQTTQGLATLAGALKPATPSSLNGPIGRQRRYSVARASLTDVIEVGRRAQASVNDVVLAAITGGFRELLLQRGEQPDPHSVRSLVPVSVRAVGDEGICENRVSLMLAFLPVHLDDVAHRVRAVHEQLAELKASGEAQAGEAMTTLARHEPFPPISWGMRLAARVPQRSIVTVTTNVPGPRQPLYLLGRRVVEILPYVPIASQLRFGVSIFTYCGQVTFGVTGDYDNAREVDQLARAIQDQLTELVRVYRPPTPRRTRPPAKAAKAAKAVKVVKVRPASRARKHTAA